jgi:hypothetical protein
MEYSKEENFVHDLVNKQSILNGKLSLLFKKLKNKPNVEIEDLASLEKIIQASNDSLKIISEHKKYLSSKNNL